MAEFDAKAYREAFSLMDDPEVDEGTRSFLRGKVEQFEKKSPAVAMRIVAQETGDQDLLFKAERMGQGVGGSASFGESGLESMRRAGINKPMSREQYAQQRESLQGHYQEKAELADTARRRETYIQPMTMPEQTASEMRAGLEQFAAEHPEEVPPEAAPGTMVIGPEGATMGGDVSTSAFNDIDKEANAELERLGTLDIDENLPSGSGRKDLYAEPEFLPPGAGFMDLLYAERFHEPPLDVARAALRQRLGAEADDITEKDHAYKRFADAMWQEARAKAEATGKPIVRIAYMTDDRWKNSKQASRRVVGGADAAMQTVLPFQIGAGKAITGGLSNEASAAIAGAVMGRDVTREMHDIEAYHPYATGAGMVFGAMAPGGLANRAFSGFAGSTPSMARMGLAGAGTGAAESYVQDKIHNAAESAFARDPRMQEDIGGRAMNSALFGAGGALVANPIAHVAGAAVRRLREGDLGPLLARAEAGGVETGGVSGVKLPGGMQAAAREAAAQGRQPVDVMLDRVMDPIASAALREQLATVGSVEAEKAAALAGKAGKAKASVSPLASQVNDELARLFDDTGRLMPVAEADRKALGKLAEQTLEVRVVPVAQARNAVRQMGGGGRRMTPEQVARLLDRAPELAEPVRQAQKAAQEAGPAARPKRGRNKAQVPDTERTAPMDEAATEPGTMLPPPGQTMPSPPFTARPDRVPDVTVESPKPYDLVGEAEGGGFAVGEIPGHVYVVGPRKLNPQQLQDTIGRLSDMIDEGKSTDLFKRLRDAALRTRDKFPENWSAKNTEWAERLGAMQKKNEAAGLPREMRPDPTRPGQPALLASEEKAFTNTTRGFGSGAGRELTDEALVDFARQGGKEEELRQIGAYMASQELRNKARVRGVVGMSANPSLYSANPAETLGLRLDPAMRALSKRLPQGPPISPGLRNLVRKILKEPPLEEVAKQQRQLANPIEALRAGQTGLMSARQLGPAAGAGHDRREKVFLNQLPPKERELLLRLVAISQRTPRQAASGE